MKNILVLFLFLSFFTLPMAAKTRHRKHHTHTTPATKRANKQARAYTKSRKSAVSHPGAVKRSGTKHRAARKGNRKAKG